MDKNYNSIPLEEKADKEFFDTFSKEDELKAIQQMRQEVEQFSQDYRDAVYLVRKDHNTVLQSQEEYDACQKAGIALKFVGYKHAVQLVHDLNASRAARTKARRDRKHKKQARRRNR